jgi:hypothetical protein
VPDDLSSDNRTPVPGIVDVLSVETVEPLVSRHEQELAALRLELADALREAEEAEQSLNRHPAASVFDDTFEADVLAQVAESLSTVKGTGDQAAAADSVRGPQAVSPGDGGTQVSSDNDSPLEAVVDPPRKESGPGSSAVPRTVVVNRGTPRTVVVDRGRPSSGPPPPVGPAVLAGDPGAAQFVNSQANAEAPAPTARRRRGRKGKGNLLARLPAGVLIQAGVVVVIVALLLLKLA